MHTKHRKKTLLAVAVTLLCLLTPTGCSSIINPTIPKETGIRIEKLLKYRDSSVTDSSAVGNIITALPAGQYNHRYQLNVEPQPNEILIDLRECEEDKIPVTFDNGNAVVLDFPDAMLKNALIILSLVPDSNTITFHIRGGSMSYQREELLAYYGYVYGNKFENITRDKSTIQKLFMEDL